MNKGSALKIIIGTVSLCAIAACTEKIPSQIIYRFDDNRYLELVGYDCEGYVIYRGIKKKTQKSTYDNPVYRVFSGELIHPSEQYIPVSEWESGAYKISKDYGQTWQVAKYMASFPALERNLDGITHGSLEGKEIERVVVANNQAFVFTAQEHLYTSSYPLDGPRLAPDDPGINYQCSDDTYYLHRPGEYKFGGEYMDGHVRPELPGRAQETMVFMKASLAHLTEGYKTNYQNLPDKEPGAVGYKGWIRVHYDMSAGK